MPLVHQASPTFFVIAYRDFGIRSQGFWFSNWVQDFQFMTLPVDTGRYYYFQGQGLPLNNMTLNNSVVSHIANIIIMLYISFKLVGIQIDIKNVNCYCLFAKHY